MKQHKWKIVAGISVIIFLVVVVVAFLGNDKNNNLDLSAFKTDSIYCYEGIPWNTSLEETKKLLPEKLINSSELAANITVYEMENIYVKGHKAFTTLTFDPNFSDITFHLSLEDDEDNLSEVETYLIRNFEKNYGQADERKESTTYDGEKFRSYTWKCTDQETQDIVLHIFVKYNTKKVYDIIITTGLVKYIE